MTGHASTSRVRSWVATQWLRRFGCKLNERGGYVAKYGLPAGSPIYPYGTSAWTRVKGWFWSLQMNHQHAAVVYTVAAVVSAWDHNFVMLVVFALCGATELRQSGRPPMKFRTIVADPPWEYPGGFKRTVPTGRDSHVAPGPMVRRDLPYPSMKLDEIKAGWK